MIRDLFINTSFRFKVMSMMIFVGVISLIISSAMLLYFEINTVKKDHVVHLTSLAQVIGANSTSALLFEDEETARHTLSALSKESSILDSALFGKNQKLLARYTREDSEIVQEPKYRKPGSYFENGKLFIHSRVVWKGENIGMVYLCSNMQILQGRLANFNQTITTTMTISILVTILLSLWMHRIISSPILKLTRLARRIAEKHDYTMRAEVTSRKDELGVLVKVFNQMLSFIQERDEALIEARDDLEKKVEERTLRVRNLSQMLQAILKNMPVIAFRIDQDGTFLESIGMGLDRLGLEEGAVVGQSAFEHYPQLVDYMKETIKGETTSCEATGILNGDRWYFSTYFFPDIDNPGQILGFALDITDRRRAEEHERVLQDQLIRAERMRSIGVLAGGVAHDLNNILGPMVILPEVIIDDIEAEIGESVENLKDAIADLRAMESSAKRAAAVIKDLMTLGRRGNYHKIPATLNQMVEKYMDSRERKSLVEAKEGLEFELNLESDLQPIICSETHLMRVLINLIHNGCDAIEESGTIRISTRNVCLEAPEIKYEIIPSGEYVVLSVSDTGEGIPVENLEKIFEPFFTKKKQTGRSGSGLGLSVVHGVVKDHDGYVDVESVSGEGTTFSLYFPSAKGEEVEEQTKKKNIEGGTEHILVVDDEPAQRLLAKRTLEKLGYTVTFASSGQEAVTLFDNASELTSPYDLVILDMIMEEGFDGLATYERILEVHSTQKAIIASGYSPTKRGKAAIELGAGWLSKPYSHDELASTVRKKLEELPG